MGSGGTGMADAGWSLGMGLGGGWWLLLVAVLLLVGVVAAVAYLSRHAGDDGDAALAVLRERYAAGDLDGEKFRRRRERLRGETD
jgi:putative membrane protein